MRVILSPLMMCITNRSPIIFVLLRNYSKIPAEMVEYLNDKLKKLLPFIN